MRLIDADVLKQHIDKLPALPDGNFAGNHSALKALINMQPTIEPSTNCSEFPNNSDTISRQQEIDALDCISGVEEVLRSLPTVQPEPAIPLSWIENEIKLLKSLDNTFSEITALQISVMVKKWRNEQNEQH